MLLANKWRWNNEHINVLEARAYLLSVRNRVNRAYNHGTRFLHLLDSKVTIGVASKGRSSSKMLNRVLASINAHLLAGHIQPFLCFVRSHLNPADKPSRLHGPLSPSIHEWNSGGTDPPHAELW